MTKGKETETETCMTMATNAHTELVENRKCFLSVGFYVSIYKKKRNLEQENTIHLYIKGLKIKFFNHHMGGAMKINYRV